MLETKFTMIFHILLIFAACHKLLAMFMFTLYFTISNSFTGKYLEIVLKPDGLLHILICIDDVPGSYCT